MGGINIGDGNEFVIKDNIITDADEIARLQAEVERYRKALEKIANHPGYYGGETYCNIWAQTALTGTQEAKE